MAEDVLIDIRTVGVETVKKAAEQIAEMGRVSETLTGKLSYANRMIMRQVEADRQLSATKAKLQKAVKDGIISQGQMNTAMKEAHRLARELVATDKEAVRVAKERENARKKEAADLESLRQKHDIAYRKQVERNKLIKEYDRLLAANMINTSEHAHLVDKATAEVEAFNAALIRGGNQFGRFDVASYNAAQRLKRHFNQGMQQAGYQIGDFAVQVQGGTNVLVALGQQGSQLAGIFGPKGAVVGAFLAIGTALALVAIKSSEAASGFEGLSDRLKSAREEFKDLNQEIRRYSSGISDVSELAFSDEVDRLTADLERSRAQLSAAQSVQPGLPLELGGAGEVDIATIEARVRRQQDLVDAAEEELRLYRERREEAERLKDLEDRRAFVAETSAELEAQIRLYEVIARHGEDSNEVEEERQRQARVAFELEAMRENIYGQQLIDLMDQYDELEAIKELAEQNAEAEERREAALQRIIAGMRLNIAYAERDEALIAARQDGVDAILQQIETTNLALEDRLLIAQTTLSTMADEEAIANAQADAARRLFEVQLRSNRILGNNLKKMMDFYDTVVATEEAARDLDQAMDDLNKAADKLSDFGLGIEQQIAQATQQIALLEEGMDNSVASFIAAETAKADALLATALAAAAVAGNFEAAAEAQAIYSQAILDIDTLANLRTRIDELTDTGGRSRKTDAEKLAEEVESLRTYNEFLTEQQNVYGDLFAIEEELYNLRDKYGDAFTPAIEASTRALLEQRTVLEEQRRIMEELSTGVSNAFGTAFTSIVDGTATAEDAFKNFVRTVIAQLFDMIVVQTVVAQLKAFIEGTAMPSITGLGMPGIKTNANGNVFSNGNIIPFASGGVVTAPTYFPMGGNKRGLMGEAGPEAIMPLKRGPGGKLGVEAVGSGDTQVINMSYNFTGGVTEADLARAMPQMVEQTKRAVVDTVQRGGNMARVFR